MFLLQFIRFYEHMLSKTNKPCFFFHKIHFMPSDFRLKALLLALPKNCWYRVLGAVVILQLFAGECTPSADWPYTFTIKRYRLLDLR